MKISKLKLFVATICLWNSFHVIAQETIVLDDIRYELCDNGTATVSQVLYDHYDYWTGGFWDESELNNLKKIVIPETISDYSGQEYQVTTFGADSPVFGPEWHLIRIEDWTHDSQNDWQWYENPYYMKEYSSRVDSIILPETITKIGKLAFAGCNSLTSIYIPSSVSLVDSCAFVGCDNLKEVHTPDIGKWAQINFAETSNISTNTNPLYFAHQLFEDGKKVTTIYSHHLHGIYNKLGNYALEGWDGVSAEFTTAVASIGSGLFLRCRNLESVIIRSYVADSIGEFIFEGCSNLKKIELPGSLKKIGRLAFQTCHSLISIEIPHNVNAIGYGAFWFCNSLQHINIPPQVTTIDAITFGYCTSLSNISIPSSITEIDECAFYKCESLPSIAIPGSVLTIRRAALNGCKNLRNIIFENSTEKLTYTKTEQFVLFGNSTLFENSPIESIYFGRDISESFRESLYMLPELKTIEFGGGAKEILPGMFSNCMALETISLGDSIKSIGSKAFANANNLRKISIDATEPPLVSDNTFSSEIYSTAVLTVPASSLDRYKEAPVWQNFINTTNKQGSVEINEIIEKEISIKVIDGHILIEGVAMVSIYDLKGSQVYSGQAGCIKLPTGIYIVAAESVRKKVIV